MQFDAFVGSTLENTADNVDYVKSCGWPRLARGRQGSADPAGGARVALRATQTWSPTRMSRANGCRRSAAAARAMTHRTWPPARTRSPSKPRPWCLLRPASGRPAGAAAGSPARACPSAA